MQHGLIHLHNETVTVFPRYPISRGMPLPAEWAVEEPDEVSLRDEQGNVLPSAGKVLQRRPDGSIEWLLADFILDFDAEQSHTVSIEHSPNPHVPVAHPVTVTEEAETVTLSNGITTIVLNRKGKLIRHLVMHGKELIGDGDRADLETVDMEGKVYRASVSDGYTVTVERSSYIRATVLVEGTHAARDGVTFLDFALRFTLGADRADLALQHTFFCREPSTGPIEVKGIRLVLPTRMEPDAKKLFRQSHHGRSWWPRGFEVRENVEIAASSVSDLNNYAAGYKPYRMGALFLRNFSSLKENTGEYPFYINPKGGTEFRADYMTGGVRQISPFVGWQQPDFTLVLSLRWWPQLHPKSVSIDEHLLTIAIWPEWATPMRIVQGVSKSHTIWLTGEPKALTVEEAEQHMLQWQVMFQEPVAVSLDPEWPAHCAVLDLQHMIRYQPHKYPKLEETLGRVVPGEPSRFTYARHVGSGMFNFGDAGGEGGFTNNEDDYRCFVPLLEYLRSGRVFALDFGTEAVEHYMEVDYCAYSTEPRKHGGLIPHTVDHFFGEVYPSHQWAEGILAYYFLTGDERARKVVLSVGNLQCWWVEHLLDAVVCDGREAGIPLVNLAAAYRLDPDEKYVQAAWTIIENFQQKWYEMWGDLKYPYPQGSFLKWTTGYGDYSTYYGMYRIWEVTGDEKIKMLLVALLDKLVNDPTRFGTDDSRTMDFFAVWAYIHLTGDDSPLETLRDQINNFLKKGGHAMRRLHFLGYLDRQGDPRLRLEEVRHAL
ncbi:MAG: exo-rhamnogalacturonan lyase family protein [Armatimonadota bacterium]